MLQRLLLSCFCCLLGFSAAYSQRLPAQEQLDAIVAEGVALYNLELAAWLGTDKIRPLLTTSTPLNGYLAYQEGGKYKVIFYIKPENKPYKVLLTTLFDGVPASDSQIKVDTVARAATASELGLIEVRQKAIAELMGRGVNFHAQKYNLNPVILPTGSDYKVYMLAGAKANGFIPLGADWLLVYRKGKPNPEVNPLHKSFIALNSDPQTNVEAIAHTHLADGEPFITPSDICTTLLYARIMRVGSQHIVMGDKYVSLFDIQNRKLTVITTKAFKKMAEDQNNR